MGSSNIIEGTVTFNYPDLPKECSTWYQVHGDIKSSSTGAPLVILHGGPGSCHNYMLSLVDLSTKHGIPVVFYDQLGCGNSTHLREKRLDEKFWTPDLFLAELDNLLDHLGIADRFDLLGQSWGGMMAASFAIRGHRGLRKLIISNSPASIKLWLAGCNRRRAGLPRDIDDALVKYEKSREYSNQEYKDACMAWNKQFMCRVDPWPDYVLKSFELMDEDDTVYFTMNGPSEFTVIGNLQGFNLVGQLDKITVPTLVVHGEFDSADEAGVSPFIQEIKHVKSHTFAGCSHMCHVEERDLYMQTVAEFLTSKESNM